MFIIGLDYMPTVHHNRRLLKIFCSSFEAEKDSVVLCSKVTKLAHSWLISVRYVNKNCSQKRLKPKNIQISNHTSEYCLYSEVWLAIWLFSLLHFLFKKNLRLTIVF